VQAKQPGIPDSVCIPSDEITSDTQSRLSFDSVRELATAKD